jgi:hypothetical protein
MELVELKMEDVKIELKSLKLKKNQNIVWKSFPYNEKNLQTIKNVIRLISYRKNEYRLTYDENLIFVEKDIWP